MRGWVLAMPDPPAMGVGWWQRRGVLRVLVKPSSSVLFQAMVISLCISTVPVMAFILYLVLLSAVCSLSAEERLPSPGAWLVFPAASAGVMDISSAHKPAQSHNRENKQTNWEVETGDFASSVVSEQNIFHFPYWRSVGQCCALWKSCRGYLEPI